MIFNKKTYGLFLFLTILFLSSVGYTQSRNTVKKVVFLNLDSTQFYSDVMEAHNLSVIMEVPIEYLAVPVQQSLKAEFSSSSTENGLEYVFPDSKNYHAIRNAHTYKNYSTEDQDYLGIAPTVTDQSALKKALSVSGAEYFVTVNLYEILSTTNDYTWEDEVVHVIHYELFDNGFNLVKAGRFEGQDTFIRPKDMGWFYSDFSLDLSFWIRAYESGGNLDTGYDKVVDSYFSSQFLEKGELSAGLHLGLGAPTGIGGISVNKLLNNHWEAQLGIGGGFEGFKATTGIRIYTKLYNQLFIPFVGLNYAFNSGLTFKLGEEVDDMGNTVNPDEISTYRILPDHSIHLRSGVLFKLPTGEKAGFALGYAYPIKQTVPELRDGPLERRRDNWVNFLSPGGFEFSFFIYISK